MAADQQAQKPNAGLAALWRFLPMLWPKGEAELKARVVVAVLLVLAGKAIGFIALPERSANVCFGGIKRNRLFMAASHSVYSLYVNTQGAPGG